MTTNWDPDATQKAIVSHALACGQFEQVNGHEPANAPGNGMVAAVWADRIVPIRSSGLAATSVRVSFSIRVYTPMTATPADAIDPQVLAAAAALMDAYSGDFELGGEARHVDLLGAHGVPMQAQAGYLNQDERQFRVMTITLPIIFDDVWEQTP